MNLRVLVFVSRHHLLSDNYFLHFGCWSRAALHQADCLSLQLLGSFCVYDSSEWRAPSCSTHGDWFTKSFSPPSVGVCVSRATLCPVSPAAKTAQIEARTAVGWGCCVWFCLHKHLAVSPSETDEEAPCAEPPAQPPKLSLPLKPVPGWWMRPYYHTVRISGLS